jgi:hypothetical protein
MIIYTNNEASFFSLKNKSDIAMEIFKKSKTFYPAGVLVPLEKIEHVMTSVFNSYKPSYLKQNTWLNDISKEVVQIALDNIKSFVLEQQRFNTLDPWVQIYGDFNKQGLRQHDCLKIRKNKSSEGLFNMRY